MKYAIFLGLIGIVLATGCSKSEAEIAAEEAEKTLAKAMQAARQEEYDRRKRARQGANALQQRMRDPASFSATAFVTSPGVVCYTYRSRNGFGGMAIGNAVYPVDATSVITDQDPEFKTFWASGCEGKPGQEISL